MSYRMTITLDDDTYGFVKQHAQGDQSAFINQLLKEAQAKHLEEALRQACMEEAQDPTYQAELAEWDVCMADGLTDETDAEAA
jgi:hypothetical protein